METPRAPSVQPSSSEEVQAPSFVQSIKNDFRELSSELWGKKFYIFKAALAALAFLALEVGYQYFVLVPGEFYGALLRGAALAGATLIGVAVSLGPLAALKPEWNFVEYRRTVGVSGFLLVCVHVTAVLSKYFNFDLSAVYYDFNPFRNPLVFGSMALSLFALLFLTSTDWAIGKLGFRNWKSLHRLIYPAFILSVLHFTQIKPRLLYNPAGYLLLGVTFAAMALQLAGFSKKVRSGKWIGAVVTIAAAALFAIAFFFKNLVA